MDPRVKSSILWGVVALLSFLVLLQGYELLADEPVTVGVKAAVAVVVGIAGAVSSHFARERLLAARS